ncbi:hypothetical protein D3C76_1468540 [compost metagenome]
MNLGQFLEKRIVQLSKSGDDFVKPLIYLHPFLCGKPSFAFAAEDFGILHVIPAKLVFLHIFLHSSIDDSKSFPGQQQRHFQPQLMKRFAGETPIGDFARPEN